MYMDIHYSMIPTVVYGCIDSYMVIQFMAGFIRRIYMHPICMHLTCKYTLSHTVAPFNLCFYYPDIYSTI